MAKKPLSDDLIRQYEQNHNLHPWRCQEGFSPLIVERAEGCNFYDTQGKAYLDFSSQFVVNSLGHSDRRVIDAICEQAEKFTYINHQFFTEPKARMARMVSEITPGDLDKCFFSNGGAEANEAAMKVVRLCTGKYKIISRYRAYHGSLYGSLSLGGESRTWPFEPALPGVVHCLEPYCYRCPFGATPEHCDLQCAKHVEDVIRKEGGANHVAAFFAEPIIGPGGVIPAPDGYWQMVREICDRHDVLMVCDEVMVGVGRTGKWFAIDHWDVVPDIITMAKGITSGYVPLGVTAIRSSVAEHFSDATFYLGHTYSGHSLAMAAGLATLEAYIEDDLIERCAKQGAYLMEKCLELQDKHPSVGDVRGKGLFVGMELVKNRKTKEPIHDPLTAPCPPSAKNRILTQALHEGVYIMAGAASSLMLTPPFTITCEQIDRAIEVIDRGLLISDGEYSD